ncbi:MAG: xanthine dehydrogenase family protein molybdopterin-binding subunit [Pseudomonadota bacterium]
MTIQTSRRTFLQGSAAAGAALVIGVGANGSFVAAKETAVLDINPFVRISPDGVVHVVIKHFEMGQGTTTGLATLVAEELDADWETLAVDLAPGDSSRYANLFWGAQGTGGSTAIANSFMQYRQAGAAARAVLVAAAADTWGVAPADVSIDKGVLRAGDRAASFGEMLGKAATMTPPVEPTVKDPADFRLIGVDGLPRKDSYGKTKGETTFAMDVRIPGMVTAVILHSPRFGGRLVSFDAADASDIPGFLDAKALPTGAGVVVYGKNTWAAIQARDMVEAEWDFSAAENRSTPDLIAYHQSLLDGTPTYQARDGGDLAVTSDALAGADTVIEAEFLFPHLAHAPMEPLNCVIEPTETGVRFHDGCQFPGIIQPVVAQVLGLDPANVEVNTVYAGGSFGRRATPLADYQTEAALAYDLLGRDTPVHLVWTREDDIQGGYYRPMAAHRAKIGIKDGQIAGWDHRIAAKSILKGGPFESVLVHNGVDKVSVEGIKDTHYAIPALSVGLTDAESPVTVLWWRSVGHTHTAYAMESLIDMAAEATGADPVDFRLSLLADGSKDQQRLAGVLKLAADKAGWGNPAPGRFQGVALHKSFESYVAEIAEVSVTDGLVKVERVVCAVDCGLAINPDVIRAQMEGGIGYGLGAIMRNQITLTDGEVDQWNFPDYEPLRISDMPDIQVHMVPSAEAPTGVGEPGTPPIGPALANAIYAATGKRMTSLPMSEHGIDFA